MSEYLPQPPDPGAGGRSPVGPYATSSMPMPPMRALKGLSTALLVLLRAGGPRRRWARRRARFNRAGLIDDVDRRTPISVDEQDLFDADDGVAAFSGLHCARVLATGVVFIIWQFRHAKNAEALGARGGLGPGWAIGGWFVPLANFVLPTVQIFQSSKASDVAGPPTGGRARRRAASWSCGRSAWALAIVMLAAAAALAPDTDDEGNFTVELARGPRGRRLQRPHRRHGARGHDRRPRSSPS